MQARCRLDSWGAQIYLQFSSGTIDSERLVTFGGLLEAEPGMD